MRTTFRIDDDLMDSLREAAAKEKSSIGIVVNRLLRCALEREEASVSEKAFRQRSHAMGTPRPGAPHADLTKANLLADEIDDAERLRAMREDR